MSRVLRQWLLKVLLLWGLEGTATAALIIDQENLVPITGNDIGAFFLGPVGIPPTATVELAQTFTVGVTGTLEHIEFQLTRSSSTTTSAVAIDIVSTINGLPDPAAGVLATVSLPSSGIPVTPSHFTDMLTGVGISLTVSRGEVLGFVLSATDLFFWTGRTDSYPAGQGFRRVVPMSFSATDVDFGFRTFVDAASAVPEPTTLVLLSTGLLALLMRQVTGVSGRILKHA